MTLRTVSVMKSDFITHFLINVSNFLLYFSYKNSSGSVTLKSFARPRKLSGVMVCLLFGCIDNIFTRISADFSAVCINPNVRSNLLPKQTFRDVPRLQDCISSLIHWLLLRCHGRPEPSTERHPHLLEIQPDILSPSPIILL